MKIKKIASFIIPLFFCASLFCEVSLTGFSITPEIGFLNGKIVENVWYVSSSFENNAITLSPTHKMSRLDWKINNTNYFGAETNLIFNEVYKVDFSFKNVPPSDCGTMEDYDWIKPEKPDYLTNYSRHINHLNSFTQIDFLLGRIFLVDKNHNISLCPLFGFETQVLSFSGNAGWKTYDSDNWKKIYFGNKTVISYSQAYGAPVFAFAADFNYLKHFESFLKCSAAWAKRLNCIDIHKERNKLFNDRIENVWKFSLEFCEAFKFLEHHKIGIKGHVSYIPDSYGFTYPSETSKDPDLSSIGGTSRFLWSYSLVYAWFF